MEKWDARLLEKREIFFDVKYSYKFDDPILTNKYRRILDQTGILILNNFCDVINQPRQVIEHQCYQFGTIFGCFDQNTQKFYDVYDRGKESYTISTRYSDTNLSHGFHTDGTKKENFPRYVILFCLEQALEGGENRLINSISVREKIKNTNPHLLEVLETPIIRDIKDADGSQVNHILKNAYPIYEYSALHGEWVFRYMRRWIEVAYNKLKKEIPTDLEKVFDLMDSIFTEDSLIFSHKLNPGDLMIFDNYFLAHDRTSFKDHPSRKRHMLRGWIYEGK